MVFSSAVFLWLFLPIVFCINLILPSKFSNIFLLAASLFFYAWGEPVYVLLMLFTILVNWTLGIAISKSERYKKAYLFLGIIIDLSILGFFKYAGFLVNTVNSVLHRQIISAPDVTLPIGISFFTFQAISYVVDVYRKDTEKSNNIINVALYISFFPQLIAGPIVKYKEISEQINSRKITKQGTAEGFRKFIYGLAKKVLIANILGKSVDVIFGLEMSSVGFFLAWAGAVMYTLQIYYDFSGYSDMAIGLGKMFGFDIPMNFDKPYLSRSIGEFWRRWHISLGSWFREYVYIPLGGNRKGDKRTLINLSVVFLLTGIWHGAGFSFIFWGIWHGFFSVMERLFLKKFLDRHVIISRIYLLLVVTFGWVVFRINNLARSLSWFKCMLTGWLYNMKSPAGIIYADRLVWFVAIAGIAGCGLLQALIPEKVRVKWNNSGCEWAYCMLLLILSLSCVAADTYNPFIYFNF